MSKGRVVLIMQEKTEPYTACVRKSDIISQMEFDELAGKWILDTFQTAFMDAAEFRYRIGELLRGVGIPAPMYSRCTFSDSREKEYPIVQTTSGILFKMRESKLEDWYCKFHYILNGTSLPVVIIGTETIMILPAGRGTVLCGRNAIVMDREMEIGIWSLCGHDLTIDTLSAVSASKTHAPKEIVQSQKPDEAYLDIVSVEPYPTYESLEALGRDYFKKKVKDIPMEIRDTVKNPPLRP